MTPVYAALHPRNDDIDRTPYRTEKPTLPDTPRTTMYLGLIICGPNESFPLERQISSSLQMAKARMEHAIEQWLGWKPGPNHYYQTGPRTQTFRWLDEGGGASYGSWPDYVTSDTVVWFETEVLDPYHAKSPVDESGVQIPIEFEGTLGIVYAIEVDAEDWSYGKRRESTT